MNPIDSNLGVRTQRGELEQGTRRSQDVQRGSTAGGGSASVDGSENRSEPVSFTRTASDLLQLENQLRELPGVDQARVESIRQAIDNGSYEVDTSRIVDSLLQSERELG